MSDNFNIERDLDTERAQNRNSVIIDALSLVSLIPDNDPLDELETRPAEILEALNSAVDDALAKVNTNVAKAGKVTPASLTKDAAQLPDVGNLRKVATIHHKAAVQAITDRVNELTEGVAAKITNLYDQLTEDVAGTRYSVRPVLESRGEFRGFSRSRRPPVCECACIGQRTRPG